MSHLYILKEPDFTKPVRVHSVIAWARWMEVRCMSRRVAQDAVGDVRISTVFLGVDHNHDEDDGAPILWETMVFRNGESDEMHRYSTYDAAKQGHAAVVARITKEMDK